MPPPPPPTVSVLGLNTLGQTRFSWEAGNCMSVPAFTRSGSTFTFTYTVTGVCSTPSAPLYFDAGFLAAGSYTVRIVNVTNPASPVLWRESAFTVKQSPVQVMPIPPTTSSDIRLVVTHPLCPGVSRVRLTEGYYLDIESDTPPVCGTTPTVQTTLHVGSLPASAYVVRFVDTSSPPARVITDGDVGMVFVAQSHGGADVPALDGKGILALTIFIAIAALFALRRAM